MPETVLPIRNYDLAATLDSGQVFRWQREDDSWIGVIGDRFVRLTQVGNGIRAETPGSAGDWNWLRYFLQTDVDLDAILKTFPDDEPMRRAVTACHGLRVLRQDPWECLASFILSSTKQIVQIRQIVAQLCECFGEPVTGGGGHPACRRAGASSPAEKTLEGARASGPQDAAPHVRQGCLTLHAFPSAQKIASLTEAQLRGCKMGFRAPNLLAAANRIAGGHFNLENLRSRPYEDALHELMTLRGVGKKIADCVLLFAYGFDSAFPVDVWVERALRELYFPKRRPPEKRLRHFAATHFGPHAGYAQQYLFHYMRTKR